MAKQKQRVLDANLLFIGSEPSWKEFNFDGADTKTLIVKTLNWYSQNHSLKDAQTWYAKEFPGTDLRSSTLGFLVRMVQRGFPKDLVWDRVLQTVTKPEKEETVRERKTRTNVIDPSVDAITEKIDYTIDALVLKKSLAQNITLSNLTKKQTDDISDYIKKQMSEFVGASKREGYENITSRIENAIVGFLSKLQLQIQTAQPTKERKQRKKRDVPIERLIKGFLVKDFGEFKTIGAGKLIGCSMAMLYDAKSRRVSLLVAEEGKTLSVKGKSVINIDDTKSISKLLRKPEEQLKDLNIASKSTIFKKLDAIKSVAGKAKFRNTETTTLMRIW